MTTLRLRVDPDTRRLVDALAAGGASITSVVHDLVTAALERGAVRGEPRSAVVALDLDEELAARLPPGVTPSEAVREALEWWARASALRKP